MGTDFSKTPNQDFIGFSYGKWHCIRDGHVYRTGDGSRYNTNLIPTLTDKTVDAPGNDGQYYFNSFHKNRTFSVNIAFDELTESDFRNLRKLLNGKDIKELIFDERPYVAYDAKVTGTPTIKALCFDDENGNRVYKGEGTIQFTCYNPYGHTPNWVWTSSFGTMTADGRLASSYNKSVYTSKDQWLPASGLTESTSTNVGDVDAPFVVKGASGKVTVAGKSITIKEGTGDWNSAVGVVVNGTVPVEYTGDAFVKIPAGAAASKTGSGTLDYEYWYY